MQQETFLLKLILVIGLAYLSMFPISRFVHKTLMANDDTEQQLNAVDNPQDRDGDWYHHGQHDGKHKDGWFRHRHHDGGPNRDDGPRQVNPKHIRSSFSKEAPVNQDLLGREEGPLLRPRGPNGLPPPQEPKADDRQNLPNKVFFSYPRDHEKDPKKKFIQQPWDAKDHFKDHATEYSKNYSKNYSKDYMKDYMKENAKQKKKEYQEKSTKENPKKNPKKDPKKDSNVFPKEYSKMDSIEQTKDEKEGFFTQPWNPNDYTKKYFEEYSKDQPKENAKKNTNKNKTQYRKKYSKDHQKENTKEDTKENAMVNAKENPKEHSKIYSFEQPNEKAKEGIKENKKAWKDNENPKESTKDKLYTKENTKLGTEEESLHRFWNTKELLSHRLGDPTKEVLLGRVNQP